MALSGFLRINQVVWVKSPASDGPTSTQSLSSFGTSLTPAPETILLLTWGDAEARHIDKYTSMYAKLYPAAQLVLVKGGVADFLYRTEQTQRELAKPAAKILSKSPVETLLVHVMSNAGSKQWCTVNNLYLQYCGHALSNAVTIIDSAPGRWRFEQTWIALLQSLPRAFLPRMVLGLIFGAILCLVQLKSYVLPGPDILEKVRGQMNDPSPTMKETRRCYIYSGEDDIIREEDVQEHAREAGRRGWAVDLVKFQGSTHVGHFKHNPERYMETIVKTWLGSSKLVS